MSMSTLLPHDLLTENMCEMPAQNPFHESQDGANSRKILYRQFDISMEDIYLSKIRGLISRDLSEPYSIYVFRYFLMQWSDLCFLAVEKDSGRLTGVIICKLEYHRHETYRGYIAMLAVEEAYRGKGIATQLVKLAIHSMQERDADEVVLETEVTNTASLRLYQRLGFLRTKKLHRYYLNGNTAYRLALSLKSDLVHVPKLDIPEPYAGAIYTGHINEETEFNE